MKFCKNPLAIALGTVLVLTFAFVYAINILADNRRDVVYQEIQRVLGKDIAFDDFDVTLLTGPGFTAKEFRIADQPVFAATPLVYAKELRMGVSLVQLFLGRIVIDKLTFVGPEFQIITNEDGRINVFSLEERRQQLSELPRARSNAVKKDSTPVSFMVTRLKVKGGRIDFIDRSIREPAEMRVKNVEVDVKGIAANGRAKFALAAALTEGPGQDVRVHGNLGPFVRGAPWKEQPLDLTVEFDSLFVPLLTRAVPFFRNRIPPELEVAGPLSLRGRVSGVLERPQIVDVVLKAPLLGSSEYNAVLHGSLDLSETGAWSEAPMQGTLRLNSVDVSRLRSTTFFQEILPPAVSIQGPIHVDSRFEGTWDSLRLGTLIRAGESEIRYGEWLRKSPGVAARWSLQASRQTSRWMLHESLLTLGKLTFQLAGEYEQGSRPRLQVRARNESSGLAELLVFVPALQDHRARGAFQADITASRDAAAAHAPWNIEGSLGLKDVQLRKDRGRDIDRLNADVSFLGRRARIDYAAFRRGSSTFSADQCSLDLSETVLDCRIRSADLNLAELAGFPVAATDRLKTVILAGRLAFTDGAPQFRGSLSSSEGILQSLPYRDLQGEIEWSAAGTNLNHLQFRALDGTWRQQNVRIVDVGESQRVALSTHIQSVNLPELLAQTFPLLKDRIFGELSFAGELEAHTGKRARSPAAVKASGDTRIARGILKDFNLVDLLLGRVGASGASPISIDPSPALTELAKAKDTLFNSLETRVSVEDKLVRMDDLLLTTEDYNISAAGWLMMDHTTRWNGLLILSPRISRELTGDNKTLRHLLDRRGQIVVPFRAEGNLNGLKVRPDTRAIAQIIRRGGFPKAVEAPSVDIRQERQEQKESLPAELEQFLSR